MSTVGRLAGAPRSAIEFANILLTKDDAPIGVSPKDEIWTHRKTTLYRYRSAQRRHAVPILLVFALINRPHIFDLRPGESFVEFLLDEGFDVFLLDWGEPGDEDADMGLEAYVLDEMAWSVRELLRASGSDEVTLLGWCIGGTLSLIYSALEPDAIRNLVLLTTPVSTRGSRFASWAARESFDPEVVTAAYPSVPGWMIDWANKMLKPVTNYWSTYRSLSEQIADGRERREAFQAMSKWIGDNPPFAGRAFREWITWMYKENRLERGTLRLRGRQVDLGRIDQNLLVVTAASDHIAPPSDTEPLLEVVASVDVTHFARPGGHIGLMAGSRAHAEIWPDIAEWLETRSAR